MGVASPSAAQPPDHLQPVHARQAEIQHDQIDGIALEEIQRRLAVAGFLDAIVLRRQRGAQEAPDGRFVVHDQDAQRVSWRPVPEGQGEYRAAAYRCGWRR